MTGQAEALRGFAFSDAAGASALLGSLVSAVLAESRLAAAAPCDCAATSAAGSGCASGTGGGRGGTSTGVRYTVEINVLSHADAAGASVVLGFLVSLLAQSRLPAAAPCDCAATSAAGSGCASGTGGGRGGTSTGVRPTVGINVLPHGADCSDGLFAVVHSLCCWPCNSAELGGRFCDGTDPGPCATGDADRDSTADADRDN